ncbi:MAG: type II toxin-antitoxin system RelE/ParE family toxin [Saprospiraceae bacterium]|nr:type II toxin-antitoxin system RelE/ParE family toxin [Saprospiraceae bacterium]
MKTYPVIWTLPAIDSLRDIFNFIKTDSPQGAKNVVTALVTLGNSLATLPARNPVEPLLADELVTYRFAVKWNYKIIYTIENESVMIVEVFDTRRDPSRLKVEPEMD